MKKLVTILLLIVAMIISSSCTKQTITKELGGELTISVEKGYKVTEATWKEGSNLWYMIEPMEDNYQPKTKIFKEQSRFGVMEGKVIFIESK